ncbi:MAG TPA: isoprenylcysteine carboxylmethyltransferase family protein [Candidatus Thermoplasmatota archaeon]|nr:isoprenylcysteine carboxylmethyltransferase family protein [Candidatus Thermoplasmatota archaeon]
MFFLVPALLLLLLEMPWPTTLLAPPWRWILGGSLLASWVALQGWAAVTMTRAGTTPLPARPTTAIVDGGPYRFTRNPMYVSFALMTAGIAVLAGSAWALAAVPVGVAGITWGAIQREERYLERKFGDAYLQYKRRVRRWI